jgi:plastocyanin
MKNTYIIIIIVILIVLGAFLFINKSKVEAPLTTTENTQFTPTPTTPTPTTPTPSSTTSVDIGASLGAVKEFTVTGQNFSFTPSTLTVNKGDKVKITFNNTQGFHNFVIDEYGVATPQKKSPDTEVLEFTANKAGSFEYYCAVGTHRQMGMKGTLIVK